MCDDMGMNITTFFMIYAKKALRDRRIPFEITASADVFYSESNNEMWRNPLLLDKINFNLMKGIVLIY